VRIATVVQTIGNTTRTVGREIGKQIDYLAVASTAIDQSLDGIAPCPAAGDGDDGQHAEPGTKVVENDGAVAKRCVPAREHRTTARSRFGIVDRARSLAEQRHAVKDYYPRALRSRRWRAAGSKPAQ
jgi:hypothetical protein